jgi:predicted alpha/beta hydrolase
VNNHTSNAMKTENMFCQVLPRVVAFKETLPMTLLPPQHILTDWSSWLTATAYYVEDLEVIEIIQAFPDTKNAAFVALVREIMKDVNVKKRYFMYERDVSLKAAIA